MEFSRQDYWSGCHFLLQEIFLTQGLNLCFLHWQVDSLPLSHQGSPKSWSIQFSSAQSLSHVQLFATPWTAALQASLSITNSWSLLMSIESVMPSKHLIFCHPLLLPSIFPSIRVFSNESIVVIWIPITKLFSGKVMWAYSPISRVKCLLSSKTLDWVGGWTLAHKSGPCSQLRGLGPGLRH